MKMLLCIYDHLPLLSPPWKPMLKSLMLSGLLFYGVAITSTVPTTGNGKEVFPPLLPQEWFVAIKQIFNKREEEREGGRVFSTQL